jgi:hypothetical protein
VKFRLRRFRRCRRRRRRCRRCSRRRRRFDVTFVALRLYVDRRRRAGVGVVKLFFVVTDDVSK